MSCLELQTSTKFQNFRSPLQIVNVVCERSLIADRRLFRRTPIGFIYELCQLSCLRPTSHIFLQFSVTFLPNFNFCSDQLQPPPLPAQINPDIICKLAQSLHEQPLVSRLIKENFAPRIILLTNLFRELFYLSMKANNKKIFPLKLCLIPPDVNFPTPRKFLLCPLLPNF